MRTSQSPRTVMCVAYHLACRLLPEHSCKFLRHDFTLAQLFACLLVREFFGLSYRRTEALLADSPAWLANIDLGKADRKHYGQRSQRETTHSMMKRNLSSALRSRTPERQKKEMMLRVLVHNIMLHCDEIEG